MKSFLQLIYFFHISFPIVRPNLPDIVINSTFNPRWSSLLFLIPFNEPHDRYLTICRKFSRIYCLQHFYTTDESDNPALMAYSMSQIQTHRSNLGYHFQWFEKFAFEEIKRIFEPSYKRINNFVDERGCCFYHNFHYLTAVLLGMMVTPDEYYTKLTDFSDEIKELNEIWAYFEPNCDLNVITKVGFGIGQLQRKHHLYGLPLPEVGKPYVLKIGDNWTPSIPFLNPGDFLTFRWFKQKVMCLDQPWICEAYS